ncbi:MAG: SWIM zinc finger family protein [Haloquadratum sp.]
MTHTRHTAASETAETTPHAGADPDGRTRTLPADGYEGRAYRARAEPMVVRPLRDGRYVVETAGGTYVVDAAHATCTCPDSAIRGARCKHVRRVSAEIEAGLLPAPDERERICAVCGAETFAPMADDGPALCERHDHDPGDLVRDRETKSLLIVVDPLGRRADETRTEEGRLVADYETNAAYGGHEPVFAAIYVDALPTDPDVADAREAKRYRFPASRLQSLETAPSESSGRRSAGRRSARQSGALEHDRLGAVSAPASRA